MNSFRNESVDPTATIELSPATWYLKVQVPGTPPALLVFGYLEQHTTPPTEVWFSGSGQFIKLRAGRVVATHGLNINWQDVAATPDWPQWNQVPTNGIGFTRLRSTVQDYDAGIREFVHLAPIDAPPNEVSTLIPGASDTKAAQWRWYSESVLSSPRVKLPPAIFATAKVQDYTVVAYSQQCLSDTFCLHIMRWPQLEGAPQP